MEVRKGKMFSSLLQLQIVLVAVMNKKKTFRGELKGSVEDIPSRKASINVFSGLFSGVWEQLV